MDTISWIQGTLPEGVRRHVLTSHDDERGRFTEVFRVEWGLLPAPVQWNVVRSAAGVFRGVHCHVRHADYLLLLTGRASVGVRDLRPASPTHGATALIAMDGDDPSGLVIPPGVAHGFLFHVASIHAYSVTDYWNPSEEMGCHWADPELGIPWPVTPDERQRVCLSSRDANLPPLKELVARVMAS